MFKTLNRQQVVSAEMIAVKTLRRTNFSVRCSRVATDLEVVNTMTTEVR